MNKFIKSIIFILFSFFLITHYLFSQNSWELISINEYPFITSIYFINESNGILVCPDVIFKTSDGGQKWIKISESNDPTVVNIKMRVKDSLIYILRSDGVIIKSNIEFSKITEIKIDIDGGFNKLFVIDEQNLALLSTVDKSVLVSDNAGKSWSKSDGMYFESSKYILDVIFINPKIGFVSSDNGKIYKTTDSGKTWHTILDVGTFVFKLYNKNDNNIWFGTANGKIYYSSDAGNNWIFSTVQDNFSISNIFFININEGFVTTTKNSAGMIFSTKDAGNTWQLDYSSMQQSTEIQDIFFFENRIGWCVGNSGLILKLNKTNQIPNITKILDPFPNPALSTTRISLQQEGDISISAVDMLGRSFPLWSGFASAGEMELDVTTLLTGTYTLLINYGT